MCCCHDPGHFIDMVTSSTSFFKLFADYGEKSNRTTDFCTFQIISAKFIFNSSTGQYILGYLNLTAYHYILTSSHVSIQFPQHFLWLGQIVAYRSEMKPLLLLGARALFRVRASEPFEVGWEWGVKKERYGKVSGDMIRIYGTSVAYALYNIAQYTWTPYDCI